MSEMNETPEPTQRAKKLRADTQITMVDTPYEGLSPSETPDQILGRVRTALAQGNSYIEAHPDAITNLSGAPIDATFPYVHFSGAFVCMPGTIPEIQRRAKLQSDELVHKDTQLYTGRA